MVASMLWSSLYSFWKWESVTNVRKYDSARDYGHIREILKAGGLEPWLTAWLRALDGSGGFLTFASQYAPSVVILSLLRHNFDLEWETCILVSLACFVAQQWALANYLRSFFMEDVNVMLNDLDDDEKGLHTLESDRGSFLVAASPEGDIPVACIAYRLCPSKGVAILHRVYVRREVRRFGIAAKLWSHALRDIRESGSSGSQSQACIRTVELWTSDAQESACRFYESNGFQLVESLQLGSFAFLHGVKDLKYQRRIC